MYMFYNVYLLTGITRYEKMTIIIGVVNIFLVVIGGIFAFIKWENTNKIRRSEFIEKLVDTTRNNEKISKGIYIIEYKNNWFDDGFRDSEIENIIDSTFKYFSYICYLKENKLLGKKEFVFFEYELKRIGQNSSTKKFFKFLYNLTKKSEKQFPFIPLLNYLMDNDFLLKENYN